MKVGIYIYPGAEVLDFSGPFEVFSTASRLAETPKAFETFLLAQSRQPVKARNNFIVSPHYSLQAHPPIDILVVTGGKHQPELAKPAVMHWLATTAPHCQWVTSVCTGVFLLAQAGIVVSEAVTTHWEDIGDLATRFPSLQVVDNQRWVESGNIITSAGISAGLDMSLALVAKTHSQALAEKTARQMDYHWQQNDFNQQSI